jgi:hypothetical protein
MTVKDLIAYLEKLPKETEIGVIFQRYSDYEILREADLRFSGSSPGSQGRYVLRKGRLMLYDESTWDHKTEEPNFVPLLVLPGN